MSYAGGWDDTPTGVSDNGGYTNMSISVTAPPSSQSQSASSFAPLPPAMTSGPSAESLAAAAEVAAQRASLESELSSLRSELDRTEAEYKTQLAASTTGNLIMKRRAATALVPLQAKKDELQKKIEDITARLASL